MRSSDLGVMMFAGDVRRSREICWATGEPTPTSKTTSNTMTCYLHPGFTPSKPRRHENN